MKSLDLDIASEISAESHASIARSRNVALDNSQRIDKAIEYMSQNLDKPLQASELAAVANVSLSHFFALFKQSMGCSPMDYFTRLRIFRACQLLDSTSARVKEIAAAL